MRRAAVLLLFCLPASASDSTVEERLTRLEAEVKELRAENQSLREQLGLQTVQKPERQSRVQVGGLLQAQAEGGESVDSRHSGDDRFFLRRARVNVQGRFAEDFDFRTEVEMTGSLSDATALRGQLTDAYVTWTRYRWLNLRAGQVKSPFGHEQLYSDPRLLVPERTFGGDRLTAGRQIGISVLGSIGDDTLTWNAGVFNGTGANTSANDDDRFLYAGRVAGTIFRGRLSNLDARLTAGVNALTSRDTSVSMPADFGFEDNTFAGRRLLTGADAQLLIGRFEFWSEVLRGRFSPEDRVPASNVRATATSFLGAYMLVPDRFQVVGRYDRFMTTTTWTAGANYYIRGHDLKLQLHFVRSDFDDITRDRVIARLQTVF